MHPLCHLSITHKDSRPALVGPAGASQRQPRWQGRRFCGLWLAVGLLAGLVGVQRVAAFAVCGNDVCEATAIPPENSQSCPADCGGTLPGDEEPAVSSGTYRIPYKTGTLVEVTNDHLTHEPETRIDMVGQAGDTPYRIVAAAEGVIRFIVDDFSENRPGESPCNNNYVWIEHPNGEWTKYSHMTQGSVTGDAGLAVGDHVEAGSFLGYEDEVGCASGRHLHFEVAVPEDPEDPIDAEGFIRGGSARNRIPRICGILDQTLVQDTRYQAASCEESAACPAGMQCCEPGPGSCRQCIPNGSSCP